MRAEPEETEHVRRSRALAAARSLEALYDRQQIGSDGGVIPRRTVHGAAFALAAVGLAGLHGCAAEQESPICDIRRSQCQKQVLGMVMALRGGSTSAPKVTVIREDELLARMEVRGEELSEEQAAARKLAYARWNRGLALFRLAPADYDIEQADADWAAEVGAVYFAETKEIVIVDRGEPLDDAGAVGLLAHEFVHALQDAEHDFASFGDEYPHTFDSSLALSGIIEGEAVMYQLLLLAQLRGLDTQKLNWERYFQEYVAKLDGQGRLLQLGNRVAGDPPRIVIRRSLEGESAVLYDASNLPRLALLALITGP